MTRVMFNPGDTITSHEGWQLHIDEVKEENGLLAYVGTRLDTEETNVTLREVLLDSKLVFSKPGSSVRRSNRSNGSVRAALSCP